jgi:protein-tyrosine phosphatase
VKAIPSSTASSLNNLRDLDGIRVQGGRIKGGVVFRSDDVSIIPAGDARTLALLGIATVIDLRSPEEAAHTGRGELARHNVSYHSVPLTKGAGSPAEFARMLATGQGDAGLVGTWYSRTAVAEAAGIARGLEIIADAPGAALFHCTAGKDRTGIFAAALLSVLGAADEDIVLDYAASARTLPKIMARVSSSIGHLLGDAAPYFAAAATGTGPVSALIGADPGSMGAMLRILREEHGGLSQVLAEAGLGSDVVHRLRLKLVQTSTDAVPAAGGARR